MDFVSVSFPGISAVKRNFVVGGAGATLNCYDCSLLPLQLGLWPTAVVWRKCPSSLALLFRLSCRLGLSSGDFFQRTPTDGFSRATILKVGIVRHTYVEAASRDEEELSPRSSVGQGGARVDKEKEEVVAKTAQAGLTVEDDAVPVQRSTTNRLWLHLVLLCIAFVLGGGGKS